MVFGVMAYFVGCFGYGDTEVERAYAGVGELLVVFITFPIGVCLVGGSLAMTAAKPDEEKAHF